jgi:DHA1 family multidrug resistance protein-like MFS transporter
MVMKRVAAKHAFSNAILAVSIVFFAMFFVTTIPVYAILSGLLGIANSVVNPLIQTILSEETDAKSQGTMQGINASYMSIGQIAGPILGGAVATVGLSYPFILASIFALSCYFLSFKVLQKGVKKDTAF